MIRQRLFICLTATLFVCSSCFGQGDLIGDVRLAHAKYRSQEYDSSIHYFDHVATWPHLFNSTINVIFRKSLKGNEEAINYLIDYGKKDLPSAVLIKPIADFLALRKLSDKKAIQTRSSELLATVQKNDQPRFNDGPYYTACYFFLKDHEVLSDNERKIWLESLETLNHLTHEKRYKDSKSMQLYLTLIIAHERYQLNMTELKTVLEIQLVPEEQSDLRSFLPYSDSLSGFKSVFEIQSPLIENGIAKGKQAEMMKYAALLVSNNPSLDNLDWLKSTYRDSLPFEQFWMQQSQSRWPLFDQGEHVNAYFQSEIEENQWALIDVWGTWCKPCIRELPEMVKMEKSFEEMDGNPIKFITLSYQSKDLTDFMLENNYDFPILEVSEEEVKALDINSYPTTLLVAPNRRYIKLPFGYDKAEMIKVYSLLSW